MKMKRHVPRQNSQRWGRLAEMMCLFSLKVRGYKIIAHGMRAAGRGSGAGEIDIVVRRGQTLAFIEVKARSDANNALEALRPAQKRRIMRSAEIFIARHPDIRTMDVRFDLMTVLPWRWPHHMKDAWRQE